VNEHVHATLRSWLTAKKGRQVRSAPSSGIS
jgi:hypothetical protein